VADNRIKVRSVGREQFWSAGRKWTAGGEIVKVVADDVTPKEFFRERTDRFGRIVLKRDSQTGEPLVKLGKDNKPLLDRTGQTVFEPEMELDLPAKDPEIQAWAEQTRREHMRRNEITVADYKQIRADSRFLAVESPDLPEPEEILIERAQQQTAKR